LSPPTVVLSTEDERTLKASNIFYARTDLRPLGSLANYALVNPPVPSSTIASRTNKFISEGLFDTPKGFT